MYLSLSVSAEYSSLLSASRESPYGSGLFLIHYTSKKEKKDKKGYDSTIVADIQRDATRLGRIEISKYICPVIYMNNKKQGL